VFSVLIFLRQRIVLCFHSLHDGMVRWMKPRSTSLLLGTITDLAKGKSELLVENALLRQQLIVLRRQVKRPACGKTDRFLLLLLVRMLRTWKQALFIVQPETLLRWHRGLFRVFTEAQIQVQLEKAEALARDDRLDKGDGGKQSPLGSGAHPRGAHQAGYSEKSNGPFRSI
jgi:hypothetical protein